MMLEYMGWNEAADLINAAYPKVVGEKFVTYDFARLMPGAHTVSTSAFGDALTAKITGNADDLARFEQERREALEQERKEREAQRVANPMEAMRASGRRPMTAAGIMSRITSYNVCYTKLLRPHFVHRLFHGRRGGNALDRRHDSGGRHRPAS